MNATLITKSTYLQGLQCLKLVWFQHNDREQILARDLMSEAILEQGDRIGMLARSLFQNGFHPDTDIQGPLVQELLSRRVPLFEVGFIHDCAHARADILEPVEDGAWDIVEVKSSTSVKDDYLHDLAFQKHVYTGAGLKINRCFILHINNNYVRMGAIDVQQLFIKVDVSDRVNDLLPSVYRHVERILAAIALKQHPPVQIGKHCNSPYSCPLRDECWSFLPENNVFTLIRGGDRSVKLFNAGIRDIREISNDFDLSEKQKIQRDAVSRGEPIVNKTAIKAFLKKLIYPVCFLDFETFNVAVPLFSGIKPYQQIPFQFSLHVVRQENADLEHYSWLAEDATDRRKEFLARLHNCWARGAQSLSSMRASKRPGCMNARLYFLNLPTG